MEKRRSLTDWVKLCHSISVEAGWWKPEELTDPQAHAVKIALIHSEISEALEAVRKGGHDKHIPDRLAVEVELADAVIRIFDLAGALELDIEGAMAEKLEYNSKRADHRIEVRHIVGGKRF